jgi:hypothetical protein
MFNLEFNLLNIKFTINNIIKILKIIKIFQIET